MHGLDGNAMDKACNALYDESQWVIDIHDAMIVCPEYADRARELYANELENIHTNRKSILEDYFTSIGIKASAIHHWNTEVLPLVDPFEGEFHCNHMVLK